MYAMTRYPCTTFVKKGRASPTKRPAQKKGKPSGSQHTKNSKNIYVHKA